MQTVADEFFARDFAVLAVLLDQEADKPDRRGVCGDDAFVQFAHREARRQGRHVEPVLCDSQTPTASAGTSAINRSRKALASSSGSPTMTFVD
jgi:hypothetical protein